MSNAWTFITIGLSATKFNQTFSVTFPDTLPYRSFAAIKVTQNKILGTRNFYKKINSNNSFQSQRFKIYLSSRSLRKLRITNHVPINDKRKLKEERERERNRNKWNKLEGRIKAEGNKHLIQHHSSSSCLFTPSPNSIWLLPPLDSTALHTPYPMCAHSTGHLYYFLFTPCSRFHPFAPSLSHSTRLIPLSPSFVAVYFSFFHFALPVVASIFFSLSLFLFPLSLFHSV